MALFTLFTDKSLNTEQLVCYTYLNLVRLLPGKSLIRYLHYLVLDLNVVFAFG